MKNIILDHSSKIVIIGFGRFGQVLGSILQENTKAQVVIVSRKKNPRHHSGLRFGTLKDIADADIIFPCVPISQFETVINKIAPMLKPNAVVIDVCSVKILPVEIMRASLPQSVQVIASHPMFGPDSYKIKNN